MPQKHPDRISPDFAPLFIRKLESVLRKIQDTVAGERSPEHTFALVHLVEGLGLAEWHALASRFDLHDWLALPLDKEDGVPLEHLRQSLEELARQRDHDFLTGLANRRMFDRVAQQELQRALRTQTPLSLVGIDLDNFKKVNDTYGHAAGDMVLVALADLLEKSLRAYDLAARLGGEEFCLMLPGAANIQAHDLTVRILNDFKTIQFTGAKGEPFSCSFSAGVATSRNRPGRDSIASILQQADDLLYQAKNQGKNSVHSLANRLAVSENPALVQTFEKQFLFTGKVAQ